MNYMHLLIYLVVIIYIHTSYTHLAALKHKHSKLNFNLCVPLFWQFFLSLVYFPAFVINSAIRGL